MSFTAFGLSFELTAPSITVPGNTTQTQKQKVSGVREHMRRNLKFMDGFFLSGHSTQRFNGDSAQVARFIDLLGEVGLWDVCVEFHDFGWQGVAFTFNEYSSSSSVRVIVNSGRKDFLLKDFVGFLPQRTEAPFIPPSSPKPLGKPNDGARQPATAVDSKSEGSEEPNPDSDGRSQ